MDQVLLPQTIFIFRANKSVGPGQSGIYLGAHAYEASRHGILQVVLLRIEGNDARENGAALDGAVVVLGNVSGPQLYLISNLEDALEDGAAGYASLQVSHVLAGLVHVEGPNHDEARVGHEVASRNWDFVNYVLANNVYVVLKNGRNWYDGCRIRHGSRDELPYLLVLSLGGVRLDEVDFILKDDDVLQPHDLNCRQVLGSLRLRAGLVARDEQESCVHDGSTVQHGGHENVVTGAVYKGNVSDKVVRRAILLEGVRMRRTARRVRHCVIGLCSERKIREKSGLSCKIYFKSPAAQCRKPKRIGERLTFAARRGLLVRLN